MRRLFLIGLTLIACCAAAGGLARFDYPITISAGSTNSSAEIFQDMDGYLRAIQTNAANASGTVTLTVAIVDNLGATVWSKASIAENAATFTVVGDGTTTFPVPIYSRGDWYVQITQSGSASPDVTHTVYLLVEED